MGSSLGSTDRSDSFHAEALSFHLDDPALGL
jgi:hypothetical protein